MKKLNLISATFAVFAIIVSAALPSKGRADGARVRLQDSVKAVAIGAPDSGPHRTREVLTAAESAESLNLVVSLRMRNFDEFQAIVQSGRTVSSAEMEANYLPLKSDYDRIAAWLVQQGLVPTLADANHTDLFFRGTVANVARALDASFARVSTADGEFTSAVTAPSLPADFASIVVGIEGLQPHVQMHAPKIQTSALAPEVSHPTRAIPSDILAAYHVPPNLNGAGQTIAIFANALPLASDLVAFDQATGTNEVPGSFTVVPINGGPTPNAGSFNEATLDTQWSTGIAPGANLRIYAVPTGSLSDFVAACTQILNEGIAKIVSSSISSPETSFAPASLQITSQLFAQMAAAGITIFHGSGDSGSYASGAAPEYPTTDPYVTALSGTVMTFDSNWNDTGETVWPNTGGGYSTVFLRPSWQTGPGVPAGAMRGVPDAAAPSSTISPYGPIFPFVVLNGSMNTGVGGTSLTGPIWAGLTAIINQARANAGLPPVGLLGPKIYPLIGTSAFNDITVGSNGAYSAGPGYDLCSGVGSPNLTALIQALANMPSISIQPTSQTIASGSTVVFNVAASGTPAPKYQWYLNNMAILGATNPILVVTATPPNTGAYTCAVTNSVATVTTAAASLTLTTTANPGRLVNLSILSTIQGSLSVGFVIGGSGTNGSEPLLIRAIGPALAAFGVASLMTDPTLTVIQQSNHATVASNIGWGTPANNQSLVIAADNATGAFALTDPTSKDSAIVASLPISDGGYSVQAAGQSGDSGEALVEVYDYTSGYTAPNPRLVNLSCLTQIGAGGSLSTGFVIGGSSAKTVLVRASGPALTAFGVAGVMPDPQIVVLPLGSGTVLASNSGWGGNSELTAVAIAVGAFPFVNPSSSDSAVLLTLQPGPYTAQVSSPSGAGGAALVEVYEVP